jgi:recombinational DNA repair protein (RecF pathway)
LYDGYRPKFEYVCSYCSTEYARDFKIKTEEKFCSRACAGKHRRLFRKPQSTGKISGKRNYERRLTKEQALEIYHRTDKSLQGLAEEYNIPKNNIWFIKKKKTYKWIHE